MKGVFVGTYTGIATIKILSVHWDPVFKKWMYKVRSTSRSNQFYKTGYEFYCYPSEVCLKVIYKNRGTTLIKHGIVNFDSVTEGEPLPYKIPSE